jgi:hypothetical protein
LVLAAVISLGRPVLADEHTAKDESVLEACNGAIQRHVNATSAAVCSAGVDYFLKRFLHEKGERAEEVRFLVAFCFWGEGIAEVNKGETALGRHSLQEASIGFRAVKNNSIAPDYVQNAERSLDKVKALLNGLDG